MKRTIGLFLFDLLTVIIYVFDVVSDIVIATQFYKEERFSFFYASCGIFILANIALSVSFCVFVGADEYGKLIALVFLLVLPFGAKRLKFSPMAVKARKGESELASHLRRKLYQHSGFLVETLAESIPQVLLQLIAMVLQREANLLSIVSILLSILSISSKAYMISYSISKRVFFLNLFSFVYDVVAMLLTVVLLFDTESSSFSSYFEHLPTISMIWFLRVLSFSGFVFLCCVVFAIHYIASKGFHLKFLLYAFLFLLGFAPAAVAFELINFSSIALWNLVKRPYCLRESAALVELWKWIKEDQNDRARSDLISAAWHRSHVELPLLEEERLDTPLIKRPSKIPWDENPRYVNFGFVLFFITVPVMVLSKILSALFPYIAFFLRVFSKIPLSVDGSSLSLNASSSSAEVVSLESLEIVLFAITSLLLLVLLFLVPSWLGYYKFLTLPNLDSIRAFDFVYWGQSAEYLLSQGESVTKYEICRRGSNPILRPERKFVGFEEFEDFPEVSEDFLVSWKSVTLVKNVEEGLEARRVWIYTEHLPLCHTDFPYPYSIHLPHFVPDRPLIAYVCSDNGNFTFSQEVTLRRGKPSRNEFLILSSINGYRGPTPTWRVRVSSSSLLLYFVHYRDNPSRFHINNEELLSGTQTADLEIIVSTLENFKEFAFRYFRRITLISRWGEGIALNEAIADHLVQKEKGKEKEERAEDEEQEIRTTVITFIGESGWQQNPDAAGGHPA